MCFRKNNIIIRPLQVLLVGPKIRRMTTIDLLRLPHSILLTRSFILWVIAPVNTAIVSVVRVPPCTTLLSFSVILSVPLRSFHESPLFLPIISLMSCHPRIPNLLLNSPRFPNLLASHPPAEEDHEPIYSATSVNGHVEKLNAIFVCFYHQVKYKTACAPSPTSYYDHVSSVMCKRCVPLH